MMRSWPPFGSGPRRVVVRAGVAFDTVPLFRQKPPAQKKATPGLTLYFWADNFDNGELKGVGYDVFTSPASFSPLIVSDEDLVLPAVFYCRVAGIAHYASNLQRADFAAPNAVLVSPEPTNKFDQNAMKVTDLKGRHMVGYLPARIAAQIVHDLGKDTVQAVVTMAFSKEGKRVGIRIVGSVGAHLTVVGY
jgi:hypothetical protein